MFATVTGRAFLLVADAERRGDGRARHATGAGPPCDDADTHCQRAGWPAANGPPRFNPDSIKEQNKNKVKAVRQGLTTISACLPNAVKALGEATFLFERRCLRGNLPIEETAAEVQ